MGVDIAMRKCEFFLAADHKSAALEALKNAFPEEKFYVRGDNVFDGSYHPIWEATTLAQAMDAVGWSVEEDKDGNIVNLLGGTGMAARYHGMEAFHPLAPFVREGSTIEMHNEDDDVFWRWVLTAGGVVWQAGRVVYDE